MRHRGVFGVKKRSFEILDTANNGDALSRIFDIFIVVLILLNLAAAILETIDTVSERYGTAFRYVEIFSVIIFTAEYVLRIWTCTIIERFRRPVTGRLRFALTLLPAIDLVAILPFYLPMLIPFDLRFLRMLRLFRVFRMLKMARYFESLRILGNVFRAKKEDLAITVFIILILLMAASSCMYFVENEAQPSAFSSIPQSMWWAIATLTTVGYGDIYPITPVGKFLGAIVSLLGIGIFALPTGIISSGFSEEIGRKKGGTITCPHCGKPMDHGTNGLNII